MNKLFPQLEQKLGPHLTFLISLLALCLTLFGLLATLGCLSSGSCGPAYRKVPGQSGQFASSLTQDLQADRTLWQLDRWIDPHDKGLDTDGCDELLDDLRGDDRFLAMRIPGPVAPGAASPLVTDAPYQGYMDIMHYGVGQVYTAPLRERPDVLEFLGSTLPADAGDQWLALSVASDAPHCPPGLDLAADSYSWHGSIHLDLSDRPDDCAGCTIESYTCFRGQSSPFLDLQSLTSYQGQGYTCVGPEPLTLLVDPTWELMGAVVQVVSQTEQIALHHLIQVISGPARVMTFSFDTDLPATWQFFKGTHEGPNLGQPISAPTSIRDLFDVWLVSEPLAETVADGPYTVRVTATDSSDPLDSQTVTDIIWVGDWVPPTDGYAIYLPLTLGD